MADLLTDATHTAALQVSRVTAAPLLIAGSPADLEAARNRVRDLPITFDKLTGGASPRLRRKAARIRCEEPVFPRTPARFAALASPKGEDNRAMAERRRKAAVRNLAAEDAPLVPVGALAVTLLDLAAPDDRAPGRPIVHVARDGGRLDALAAVLRVLAPAAEVAVFPEWDCLPFECENTSRHDN